MRRGRRGTLEMNEVLHLSGDFGYPLPICDDCVRAKHLHFVGDDQCFEAIRSMNEYFKTLYQHRLNEDDIDGLNVVNKDCIKEFTKCSSDVKVDKIPEKEYSKRVFDYFQTKAEPLRFDDWVMFLEIRDVNNVIFMGEPRAKKVKLTSKNQRKNELIELIGGGSREVNEYASRLLDRSAA